MIFQSLQLQHPYFTILPHFPFKQVCPNSWSKLINSSSFRIPIQNPNWLLLLLLLFSKEIRKKEKEKATQIKAVTNLNIIHHSKMETAINNRNKLKKKREKKNKPELQEQQSSVVVDEIGGFSPT